MEPSIGLLTNRIINQQVRRLREMLGRTPELAIEPPAGSPARADLDHINSRPDSSNLGGLRWWVQRAAALNVAAAEEHLDGVRAVLGADALLPLPAMALGRTVYEAVINTCWLVDVEVSTEQRLARWAGRLLHDGQEPTAALDSFGEVEATKTARERVVEARSLGQRLMAKAGFELKAKGGARFEETARVTYCGESSSLVPNVTALGDRFTPGQNLWSLFSGATHSRGWLVAGLEGTHTEVITSVVAPLLDTSDALAVEFARYFGLDPRLTLERSHTNRVALLRRARPGSNPLAGVDAYRAAVGAWPLPPRG